MVGNEYQRYFVGIELPPRIRSKVDRWRKIWYPYGVKTAPPHITLIPPFKNRSNIDDLFTYITQPLMLARKLDIHLGGFDSFNNKSAVFFINVELTEGLQSVYKKLTRRIDEIGMPTSTRPFRPHITIASRLSELDLRSIKQRFANQKVNDVFAVNRLTVWGKDEVGIYHAIYHISLDKITGVRYDSNAAEKGELRDHL